jgi:hypothetical protein
MRDSGERGENAFWTEARQSVDAHTLAQMERLVAEWSTGSLSKAGRIDWGKTAVFVMTAVLERRGLFALYRNGSLELYIGYWDNKRYSELTPRQVAFRDRFVDMVSAVLGRTFETGSSFPKIKREEWVPKADHLIAGFVELSKLVPTA